VYRSGLFHKHFIMGLSPRFPNYAEDHFRSSDAEIAAEVGNPGGVVSAQGGSTQAPSIHTRFGGQLTPAQGSYWQKKLTQL